MPAMAATRRRCAGRAWAAAGSPQQRVRARRTSKWTAEAREVGALGRGRAAELREVVGGQIGTPARGVLPYVPQDLGELEREPERVRILRRALGAARPGSVPNTPSESRPIAPATHRQYTLQVVPGLVRLTAYVHQDAVDEFVEAAQRHREIRGGVAGDRDRVGVVLVNQALADPGEQSPGVLEPRRLRIRCQRAVADVVDTP